MGEKRQGLGSFVRIEKPGTVGGLMAKKNGDRR